MPLNSPLNHRFFILYLTCLFNLPTWLSHCTQLVRWEMPLLSIYMYTTRCVFSLKTWLFYESLLYLLYRHYINTPMYNYSFNRLRKVMGSTATCRLGRSWQIVMLKLVHSGLPINAHFMHAFLQLMLAQHVPLLPWKGGFWEFHLTLF